MVENGVAIKMIESDEKFIGIDTEDLEMARKMINEKALSKLILTYVLGWKIASNKNLSKDKVKKAVLISAPHTHWFDLFLGLFVKLQLGLSQIF